MSRQIVGIVIDRLLTDEDLRIRFALSPLEALAELNFRGLELTQDELDVFIQTDARLWFWGRTAQSTGFTGWSAGLLIS